MFQAPSTTFLVKTVHNVLLVKTVLKRTFGGEDRRRLLELSYELEAAKLPTPDAGSLCVVPSTMWLRSASEARPHVMWEQRTVWRTPPGAG